MASMRDEWLDLAAKRAGIIDRFTNMTDDVQSVSDDTKRALLAVMGRDQNNNVAGNDGLDPAPLPPVKVFLPGDALTLTPQGSGKYQWQMVLENGVITSGEVAAGQPLMLDPALPLGYHQLSLVQQEQLKNNRWNCRIIIAPAQCYQPPELMAGEKLWGTCVQLYTLRSENNWGVGDFSDLKHMVQQIGTRGGAFVGLNPIHALYPANPLSASPYSPSSRRWLNVIYIDVTAVKEFYLNTDAQIWWQLPATRQALRKARSTENVDYEQVMQLKSTALKLAWPTFSSLPEDNPRKQDFRHFVHLGGESLRQQAVFDALHAHLRDLNLGLWGWPVWPEPYRNAQSADVAEFCDSHQSDIEFYLWLQWLANRQFAECYQVSEQLAMPIGLYRDLAVGVAVGGAETWCNPSLYCLQATIGAPPDLLGPQGQNWGLPPIDPHIMNAKAYQPFIDLLRANMESCGALRIDHVMGLMRLWWIPVNQPAGNGAYVRYPLRDLLGVLALESQRHQCMVIGEDLGIVPREIVTSLRDSGIYSYKVLYFEHDKQNLYRAPQDYLVQAMATVTTHDLPTLRGYWQGEDLDLGQSLGIYPDEDVLVRLRDEREGNKQGLLDGLRRYRCVPKNFGRYAKNMPMTPTLNRGLQRYLADGSSALLGLQPEDWLDMSTPVNVPGTNMEYPNWRRKLTQTLEVMFSDPRINRLIKDLDQHRKAASGR